MAGRSAAPAVLARDDVFNDGEVYNGAFLASSRDSGRRISRLTIATTTTMTTTGVAGSFDRPPPGPRRRCAVRSP